MGIPCIEVAQYAGVCYGVERALTLAKEAGSTATGPVCTMGPLIHNPIVVHELEQSGVSVANSVEDCVEGAVIIRAHGVVPQVIDELQNKGLQIIDATCPFVKKVHVAAERLEREGYQLLVVGESGHPEVEGIMGHAGMDAHVVSSPEDLHELELGRKVGIVVQTTQTADTLNSVVASVLPRVSELRVVNTICTATQERQASAAELASRADVMIVVGGKNSGNTQRLAQICSERCSRTYHIEQACELDPSWLEDAQLIGVTAGASTPAAHIEQVVEALRNASKA